MVKLLRGVWTVEVTQACVMPRVHPPTIAMSPLLLLACLLLAFRVAQRLYYLLRGHTHLSLSHRPRDALEAWLQQHTVPSTCHAFKTRHDGVEVRYRRLGSGSMHLLLANGVGTDLHMWLRVLVFMQLLVPDLFSRVTILALTYRGLFEDPMVEDDHHTSDVSGAKGQAVDISIDLCAQDILELIDHAQVQQFHTIIGWSTGAQVALACCRLRPSVSRGLFLLNPSTGFTLHTFGQAMLRLPHEQGAVVSACIHALLEWLVTVVDNHRWVWTSLRWFARSVAFRFMLEAASFFGGFPPEQAACFQEYMRDQFSCPRQTKHLLALILSLDDPPPPEGFASISQDTVILSGFPDFLTGVYHSHDLASQIPVCRHVVFSMASHFLLIEWPDLLAKELVVHTFGGSG